MSIKTYIANQRGQAPNGAIVEEGQKFTADFREIVRDDKGAPVIEDGKVKTKSASKEPSWADEAKEDKSDKKSDDKKG